MYYLRISNFKNENVTSDNFYWLSRNQRSEARAALTEHVNYLSVSDMDSVRIQLGLLSKLTSQTDEISRNTGVNWIRIYMNFKLILSLKH